MSKVLTETIMSVYAFHCYNDDDVSITIEIEAPDEDIAIEQFEDEYPDLELEYVEEL